MGVFTRATASRSRTRTITLGSLAILGASALVLTGCSSPGGGDGDSDQPAGDLTLKIGTQLPQTGNLAFLGPPEEAGVGLAAKEINDADLGIEIDVVYGDSGDTDNKAYATEVPRLLQEGVSAIIGAAASGVTKLFIDQVTGEGVIQFSPANTSADFTTWDDNGLFWRTAPSDVLQGEVLGNLIAEDGNETLGILYLNDSYGTGLAEFTTEAFENAGGEVVEQQSYNTGDTSFDAQVSALKAANPDAIALIAFEETKTIVPALAGFPSDKLYFVDGNLADYSADFPAGTLTGAKGTLPGLDTESLGDFTDRLQEFWQGEGNEELKDYSYAAESYDAVVLLALAAMAAGSTDGEDIAAELQEVSGGSGEGTKCSSFTECAELLNEGETIDYDGNSGPVTFDENGDPTEATIGVFQYLEDNTYERISE
ncbi:ABC transporter substrate-binding protein [Mycetocola zhujimingii]|uniref:Amino acid ABC transporter substrate-binding protein n=1 Tax=Mycetocola zhujimingii TaxID=2079792 RepID=A0A2U1TDS6_9MICO|nr:ABC transporter substrate-binding protein [Mycetocola zhujimingii]AWB87142.1 amino acid ABC transporter substrate-binding protein [Mycetocola zhujimingii]PWC07026.1 amino acid ABC transporter substrate-binding protein [Mycetocola zhujimingii]